MQQNGSLTLENGMAAQRGGSVALSDASGYLPTIVTVYLFSLLIPAMFKLGSVAMSGPRMILLVLVVPLMVDLFTGKFGKTYPIDYLFVAFIGWATIAVAVNNPNAAIQHAGSTGVEFLGGYLVGRAYVRTPGAFYSMMKVGFIMILISLPFGILEMKTGVAFWPAVFRKLPGFNAWADVANPPRMGLERAQVFFSHPIHQGLFCSLFFSLIFIGLRDKITLGKRVFMTGLVVFGTVMALSSAPLLSTLLQIGLITWAYIFRQHPMRWWYLIALFAAMYVAIDLLSNRTPSRVLMTYATFSPQTAYYRAVINEWGYYNVWHNPVFGLGLRDWVRPDYMQRGSVDNFWLLTAMRYGIPGFLILAAGYADAAFRVGLTKTREGTPTHHLRQAWTTTIVGMSFVLYTVHVWTSIYSFIFFLVGAGLWIPGWVRAQQEGGADLPAEGAGQATGRDPGGIVYSRAGARIVTSRALQPAETVRAPIARQERSEDVVLSRFGEDDETATEFSRAPVKDDGRATPGSKSSVTFSRFDGAGRSRKQGPEGEKS